MGRVLGVDLGSKRIGLALSDPLRVMATPFAVIERAGDVAADHRAILDAARGAQAERIVVGLPVSLTGKMGPMARAVVAEAEQLAETAGDLPVETYDERFSTVSAERALREGGVRGPAQRERVDKVAAAIMLQSWLDGRR